MRDEFYHDLALLKLEPQWGLPIIKKEIHNLSAMSLVAYHMTPNPESWIHFFIDDSHFLGMCRNPVRSLPKILRSKGALSPDFSLPWDWPIVDQLWNTRKNRFFGAFWQYHGVPVIPTISWSDEKSYPFCFSGIEKGGTVAIGTLGIHKNKNAQKLFLQGYHEMRNRLEPHNILCYGRPIEGMEVENVTTFSPFDAKFWEELDYDLAVA